ncbi:hypothetical protein [Mesorhizobium sp.]|uniref:hypothetical protein n=1 Tax=Mesorhizobium sp. TaxID=1871066 RepID=UPI000FE31839|nr:hypothetical protein [Mesorhizobium sp.]RWG83238.1 MAG: hypothetical protein EOQ70_21760 [Mesorhizobium sp.]RWK16205.1 MAG: hypothetical protein EOR41_20795 [Mesorhizobium sp.]TIQ39810.1 MAG: hypothetical protein E5X49_26380 [Mesorhizobium sp.]
MQENLHVKTGSSNKQVKSMQCRSRRLRAQSDFAEGVSAIFQFDRLLVVRSPSFTERGQARHAEATPGGRGSMIAWLALVASLAVVGALVLHWPG